MRDALRAALDDQLPCDHAGLLYQMGCSPQCVRPKGESELNARELWLARVAAAKIPQGYEVFWQAHEQSLLARAARGDESPTRVVFFHATLLAPLLVGHGNASPSQAGLTLHHAWGVPVIPGSALKGLVAHFTAAVYGPERLDTDPAPDTSEARRAPYRPTWWVAGRPHRGPGEAYLRLFGSPEIDAQPGSARAGEVHFYDALPCAPGGASFLIPDVITPHHASYYEGRDNERWPDEHEDPKPVPFVSVAPGLRFLFAVEGPPGWVECAFDLLTEALAQRGIGGKTARGYGRFEIDSVTALREIEAARERRKRETLPRLAPTDRWRGLVRDTPESSLLHWAQEVFQARRRRSPDLVEALASAGLDPDVEDQALRKALNDAGYLRAWRSGHALGHVNLGRGMDNLRALAECVSPTPPAPTPVWRARLDSIRPDDFDALKALTVEALAQPDSWPLEGLEAILAALRKTLGKNPKPAKKSVVDTFAHHVRQCRQAARRAPLDPPPGEP